MGFQCGLKLTNGIHLATTFDFAKVAQNRWFYWERAGSWKQLEFYIEKHLEAQFSHGICIDCADKLYGETGWYIKFTERSES